MTMAFLAYHYLSLSLSLLFLLLLLLRPASYAAADTPPYTATDLILLSCGAPSNSSDITARTWESDHQSSYLRTNAVNSSLPSAASRMHPSVPDPVPFRTARVFHSPSTYSFPVSSGHKFIRLYFYPDVYSGFNTSQSFFSVAANGFTLLSNFSAFLNSPESNPSFVKEYLVHVDGNQRIDLTFTPCRNSFAFINGIEIVSLPENLYFRQRWIKYIPSHLSELKNNTALETLYRLNVGGGDIQIKDDTGMFRYWSQDDLYIKGADFGFTPHDEDHIIKYTTKTPPYSAPKMVYRTSRTMANTSKSLKWAFPVDSGFLYLLRFHFCEIQLEITRQNERVFTINVDNQTAEIDADVIFWTGGSGIPIFRDYIAFVPDDGRRGKKDLRLSLFPSNVGMPKYSNALLNGLEIFKMSDSKRSLSAANPEPVVRTSVVPAPEEKKSGKPSVIYALIGGVIGGLAVAVALGFLIFHWHRKAKDSSYYDVIRGNSSDHSESQVVDECAATV